ncbi:MAG: hypothetical protein EOP11_16865 [Proteobacteria bacterium]|nr:MAG: hypothetical protein EOP11_16865 [Pseudomonadota bacterium]
MKLTILLCAAFFPLLASASDLTYRIDLDHSKMDAITAFDICGLPKEIKLDAREDLATVVIKELSGKAAAPKIQFIQATSGAMSGGGLTELYSGNYRTRVALVNLPATAGAYRGGVYERVELNTFGSPKAPKSFTVDKEPLNYRESAELGEDSVCTGIAYFLL